MTDLTVFSDAHARSNPQMSADLLTMLFAVEVGCKSIPGFRVHRMKSMALYVALAESEADSDMLGVDNVKGVLRMRVPSFFWGCCVAPPSTLFPQCLWSRKTVARPSFSIPETLQVVPKHLRNVVRHSFFNE